MEEFDFDDFNFEPDWEFEEELTRKAFENTYKILIGATTMKELMDNESMQSGSIDQKVTTALLFNPMGKDYSPKFPHLHNPDSRADLIDSLITYFTETEEYEKCAKLVKLKKKLC